MIIPIKAHNNFKVIAHRGASGYAPENTLASFELAYRMGVFDLELDVQMTYDKKIVICHQDNLEKFGHPSVFISNTKLDELQKIDIGSWFSPFLYKHERIVEISRIFELYGNNITYHIELKENNIQLIEELIKVILNHKLYRKIIVTSFSYEALLSVFKITQDIKTGWLIHDFSNEKLKKAKEINAYQLCLRIDLLDKETVSMVQNNKFNVRAWGLNGERESVIIKTKKAINIGCDGATLNWPDWVVCSS